MGETSSSRRTFLAGATGAIGATAGCIGELRNMAEREGTEQLSLTVSTLPISEDPYAVRIANALADNLAAAGIETSVDPMSPDVLLREILINHDFDIYVARYPSQNDPDELRSLLYSAYAEEGGWQNPFGYSDLSLDDLLDEQRDLVGEDRMDAVGEIQRRIVREQPFTVVGFPDRIGAVRTDRFRRWGSGGPTDSIDYLQLERTGDTSTLKLLLRDDRITRNWNPIAAEHRNRGNLIKTLYEPLTRSVASVPDPIPWLARTISWNETSTLSAEIQLRETPWHDGEPVTADDVAFTYEFLQDTSLGGFDTPVPTPWRRGRISLVESVAVESDRRLRIEFETPNRELASRALTTPILPKHVWIDRTGVAELAGIDLAGRTTEALVTPNEQPVGSGPVQFESAVADESLSLVAFPDHFLSTGDTENIPERFVGGPPFDRIEYTATPSHNVSVELLINDEADAAADGLRASVVPDILHAPDVSLTVRRNEPFYHVGYNCRQAPTSDPHFRRAAARHIDREFLVADAMEGYGTPSEVPLKERWIPDQFAWDGAASLSFFGDDGDLDAEAARSAFREAGYQYDDERLVRRGGS